MITWGISAGIIAFIIGSWGRVCLYYEMTEPHQMPSLWSSSAVQVGTFILTAGFSLVFAFIAAGWVSESYGDALGAFSFGVFLVLQWVARSIASAFYVIHDDGQLYDAIADAKNSRRGSTTSKDMPARELPKTASQESGHVPKDNTIMQMFGLVGLAVLFIVFWTVLSSPQDTAQDTPSEGDGLAELGYKYDIGDGVEEDNVEAVRLYRLAAEKGNARGQYYLGTMFETGEGLPRNTIEAAKWYRLAAEHGYSAAQFTLGLMFETGEGVSRNTIEAVKWYRLAAEQGNADARERLAEMGF
ncbi:MAG: sel1 repeat family protein [Sphingomonadales bacterium]|nr:sel1 repeat family protein [Sphingomonadales bacterium]